MIKVKKLTQIFAAVLLIFVVTAGSTQVQAQIKISHELGTAVVPKNPQTVVVFDYAILDTLDNMGVKVVGLPKSSIPAYLAHYNGREYVDVGTLFEPNFEKVYELRPDLILIGGRQASVYPELARIAPTVYLTIDTADYLGSFAHNLRILGEIFDQKEFVEAELAKIEQEFAAIQAEAANLGANGLLIMANDGALSAFGPNSRFGVIHKEFGFPPADPNIEIANHGQNVSFEYLARINPDFLFVVDRAATVGGSISAEQVLDNEIVRSLNAYKSDRIIYLTSQVWYAASGGLTGTKIMIEDINQIFK